MTQTFSLPQTATRRVFRLFSSIQYSVVPLDETDCLLCPFYPTDLCGDIESLSTPSLGRNQKCSSVSHRGRGIG